MNSVPDIIRAAYAELIVTDLERSRRFYCDILGLVITHEDENAIYLRAFEEYLHHSLVLRKGDTPALAVLAYRVRSQAEVALAAKHFESIGCAVERRAAGATRGIGEAVRVIDPLSFPIEFFYDAEHVERYTQRYDVHGTGALSRLDHFNILTPDVPAAQEHYESLGFRVSEDIQDDKGTVYASWLFRKATVHDIALT
ncbi:MAG TPA: VOC family protein, partial [Terrimesophilobacter sp.]|nr:VOC family protein [Terrimesophilobacter sp.]